MTKLAVATERKFFDVCTTLDFLYINDKTRSLAGFPNEWSDKEEQLAFLHMSLKVDKNRNRKM